ncbi:hypothetical protein (mitochondrion) [Glycine soja]|uniref:Uncharacterized protein n=2 Tax=Glycine subgen. Soja TaxID=1462606 RepID=M1FN42_SOYBN|nr:hypothetical protein I638_mgp066 [Glycine max]YP_009532819.1 hypothetical protein [Glycine soja]AFR34343.1 hypothetical protein GlmaxMp25 [Glycine max]AYD72967.1 hypothetical protein [Glycine soja]|eukprot:YP_007516874.1 hypothetical protein GlmaxMp25 (mitochondrion) [Glycine max]
MKEGKEDARKRSGKLRRYRGKQSLLSRSCPLASPRSNRQAKSTRSSLVCLLIAVKPMVRIGHIGDLQLGIYTKNLKTTTGNTPFIMVYGAEAIIPRSPVYDWQYRIDWET